MISVLFRVGENEKALEISQTMASRVDQNLDYYIRKEPGNAQEIQTNLYTLNQIVQANKEASTRQAAKFEQIFEKHYNSYASLYARGMSGG
jgi:hypothetical protein